MDDISVDVELNDNEALFEKRLVKRLTTLERIRDKGIITAADYITGREKILAEEMERLGAEITHEDMSPQTFTYSKEEVDRDPELQKVFRREEKCKRMKKIRDANIEAWETMVRNTFMAICKDNRASPLIVMMGEFLIMDPNREEGRRALLDLLIMDDPEERIKDFNTIVMATGPDGIEFTHGTKVTYLPYPLFSFREPDLAQRNARIFAETTVQENQEGSHISQHVRNMYSDEAKVLSGGSIPFPVLDGEGTPSGYYVDVEPIHQAFTELRKSVQARDGQEATHLSLLKKLLEKTSESNTKRRYENPHVGRGDGWNSSYRRNTRGNYPNARYRGGEAPQEPKNEFPPS